ncbi:hypothetical protein PanWU01x14_311950 [Parasponia andersonii]|uniref:Uncharacterized protein n=1 Tax=Parasponia andersonii TaxID=3476 RepID=A0A2P5AQ03_PARAD|nr:hypothetical protein PanWU01x14_311950 [Parasponia andersonii]
METKKQEAKLGHMITFDAFSFGGNPGLCGAPLVVSYPGEDDYSNEGRVFDDSSSDDGFIDTWFVLSVGLGYAAVRTSRVGLEKILE